MTLRGGFHCPFHGESDMRQISTCLLAATTLALLAAVCTVSFGGGEEKPKEFKVYPIGYVRKAEGRTTIVLDKKYEPGLLRMDELSEIWVFWWFDRNDTPEKRSILRVHPRGNPENPLTGVFATHSPVRPNLIASNPPYMGIEYDDREYIH